MWMLLHQAWLATNGMYHCLQMAEVVAAKDALDSEVKLARKQLEQLQAELSASKSEVVDLSAELQEKSGRLAHLEGEGGQHCSIMCCW
jgi:hypothetical protein